LRSPSRCWNRGVIDVNAPVAQWWPGFATNGKAALTVLDVLTHRAGVFAPELVATLQNWSHDDRVRQAMEQATGRAVCCRICRTSTGGFWPRW